MREDEHLNFKVPTPIASDQSYIENPDVFKLLAPNQQVSSKQIHQKFLKLIRHLLCPQNIKLPETRDHLQALCIVHDVLVDRPSKVDFTETAQKDSSLTQSKEQDILNTNPYFKIGELLEHSNILEGSELDIGLDMHKAMPEMRFGEFLVKQGYLNEKQLEAALIGQKLIASGTITIKQFQSAMNLVNAKGISLQDALSQTD